MSKKPPNFSAEEDLVIVRAAYELKAFSKPKQDVEFGEFAHVLEKSPHCKRSHVSWRTVRDRFFRIMRIWKAGDAKKKAKSGDVEEVTPMDEMLTEIVSILGDKYEEKQSKRETEKKKKESSKRTDEFVLECASNRLQDRQLSSKEADE